jgi:hypothetical protein
MGHGAEFPVEQQGSAPNLLALTLSELDAPPSRDFRASRMRPRLIEHVVLSKAGNIGSVETGYSRTRIAIRGGTPAQWLFPKETAIVQDLRMGG